MSNHRIIDPKLDLALEREIDVPRHLVWEAMTIQFPPEIFHVESVRPTQHMVFGPRNRIVTGHINRYSNQFRLKPHQDCRLCFRFVFA